MLSGSRYTLKPGLSQFRRHFRQFNPFPLYRNPAAAHLCTNKAQKNKTPHPLRKRYENNPVMQSKLIFLFWLLGLGFAQTPAATRQFITRELQEAAQPALRTLQRLAVSETFPFFSGQGA